MRKTITDHDSSATVAERIGAVMKHLNISAAHFGVSAPIELAAFMSANSNALSSLTLLNASRLPLDVLPSFTDRLLIFSGDAGLGGEAMQRARPLLAGAQMVDFSDYPAAVWTDMAADHAKRIVGAMLEFLTRKDQERPATRFSGKDREGVVAGISYDIFGEGPAVFCSRHYSRLRNGPPFSIAWPKSSRSFVWEARISVW
jgi:hypothetical protein